MKDLFVATLCFLVFISLEATLVFADNDYGDGYQRGYQRGYQYQENGGIEPIAPIAPVPPIPRIGDSGYDDGYRRGVIEGYNKKQDRNSGYRY